jgi:hypothetical protein
MDASPTCHWYYLSTWLLNVLGQIAMDWGIKKKFQTGSAAYPASQTNGTGYFPVVKQPRRGVDHLPPPSAAVKERVEPSLFSLWVLIACSMVKYININFDTYKHNFSMIYTYVDSSPP